MTYQEQKVERNEENLPVSFYFGCTDNRKQEIWIRPQPIHGLYLDGSVPLVTLTAKAGLSENGEPTLKLYVDNRTGYNPARISFYHARGNEELQLISEHPKILTVKPASLPMTLFCDQWDSARNQRLENTKPLNLGPVVTEVKKTILARPLSILVVGGDEGLAGQMATYGETQMQTCDEFKGKLEKLSEDIWQKLHAGRKNSLSESAHYAAKKAIILAHFPYDTICFGTPPADKINFAWGVDQRKYYFELSQTLLLFCYRPTVRPTGETFFLGRIVDLTFSDIADPKLKHLFREYLAYRPAK